MTKRSALLEIAPGKFHVFPSESTTQDLNMSGLGASKGVVIRNQLQKDGTRIKYINTNKLSGIDIINRIYDIKPGHEEIVPELKLSPENFNILLNVIGEAGEYRIYKTNLFTDSYRVFPILVDHTRLCCYNLQPLFSHLIPEDNLGILIRDENDLLSLTLPKLGTPKVIEYLSNKRMCPMCGVVSDHTKPPKQPWHSARKATISDA